MTSDYMTTAMTTLLFSTLIMPLILVWKYRKSECVAQLSGIACAGEGLSHVKILTYHHSDGDGFNV